MINLSPGPVEISRAVVDEITRTPISHRSPSFREDFSQTQNILCSMVNSRYVEIVTGSGTLANEMVAAQLSLLPGKGIIMTSGEFSERLQAMAKRQRLEFIPFNKDYGSVYDFGELEQLIDNQTEMISWIWTTHCETSTGYLIDLEKIAAICTSREIKLCLDCISSIGTIKLDLSSVYLATASSGKALGSYAGLAMVFYNHDITPDARLPCSLDIGFYKSKSSIPFTISSCLLYGLKKAAELKQASMDYNRLETYSSFLRKGLESRLVDILVDKVDSSPAIFTIPVPGSVSSLELGEKLKEHGYLLSFESEYLVRRNHIQICLMSPVRLDDLMPLPALIKRLVGDLEQCTGDSMTLSKLPVMGTI